MLGTHRFSSVRVTVASFKKYVYGIKSNNTFDVIINALIIGFFNKLTNLLYFIQLIKSKSVKCKYIKSLIDIFNKCNNTNNFYPFQYFKLFSKIIGI